MSPPPIWLDTNVLVNIDNGKMPNAAVEIINLQRDGHQVLLPPSVEMEFLHGQGLRVEDTVRRQALLPRLGVSVDTMVNQVPMQQLRAWRDQAVHHQLSIPDADIIAQIRASAQARGIENPIFLTRDAGGTLIAMRQRGVMAIKFRAPLIRAQIPNHATPRAPREVPKPPLGSGGGKRFFAWGKAGLKAGLKAAFSAENIAAMIPELILALADRVAAREAARKIKIKFTKEGFAKGVAAGVMGFTEEEVALNLMNHVTDYRTQGLEDPAGYLTTVAIFKLAQTQENYAVAVGYEYSSPKTLRWKKAMGAKGIEVLRKYGYYFGEDPEALFEYDFIDKLAWVLRPTTDSILEHEFRFNP